MGVSTDEGERGGRVWDREEEVLGGGRRVQK